MTYVSPLQRPRRLGSGQSTFNAELRPLEYTPSSDPQVSAQLAAFGGEQAASDPQPGAGQGALRVAPRVLRSGRAR